MYVSLKVDIILLQPFEWLDYEHVPPFLVKLNLLRQATLFHQTISRRGFLSEIDKTFDYL